MKDRCDSKSTVFIINGSLVIKEDNGHTKRWYLDEIEKTQTRTKRSKYWLKLRCKGVSSV
jgi:hypothetical protein